MPIRDWAVSAGVFFSTGSRSPCMNIDGQPMTSTSRKPMSFRYCSVNSPRTPMEALCSSTAAQKARTLASMGFSRAGS